MTDTELELPKGWVKTKLDDVVIRISNGTSEKQTKEKTKFPVTRIETISDTEINFNRVRYLKNCSKKILDKYKMEYGDILFSNINSDSHLGKTAIFHLTDIELIHGMNLLLIRSNREIILPKLLNFIFNYHRTSGFFYSIAQHAVNQSSINQTRLKKTPILLPPLNEQKRIVSKIEELFSKIDSTKQSLEHTKLQLELYRQSLFKSLFNRTTNFVTLEECAKIGSGGTPSRQKPEYYGGDIPWVKTTEVQNSYIQFTSEKITALGLKNSSAKIYPKSSVIVAMYGEGKTRGKCAILNINASTNQACAVIICDNKKLLYKFCFYWFQSQYDQMRLKSSGGNQPNLNLGIIKKTKIPLPPLEEQKEIVSQIEQGFTLIENTSKIIESTLQKLQTMKMSVLKQAFEGKLVPQDPNDEPASVILEKIKSTKESQSTKQRGIKNVK
ncbi:MAG: hypothetical protein HN875_02350 [Candidatus Nitrosopelagicus sp.]|nr:hypothetical protein [Candidatus Nitrosopelagicus sp.]